MNGGGEVYAAAERYRRALLARERGAASALVRAYGAAWQRIRGRLDELTRQIAAARAAGEEVGADWLYRQGRLRALQRQVEAEIGRFAGVAEASVAAEQAAAVAAAQGHAEQLALAGLGEGPAGVFVGWNRLPREALADLVGFLENGSPLRALLDELGPAASEDVRRELLVGLATGLGPREIARGVRLALGGNLTRALVISRTETLRAYREASRRSYVANADVVRGWVWHASLDNRCCMSCVVMHGTAHGLDERLDDHPNGRCAMLPVTRTWAELGFPGIAESRPEMESGVAWFERQSAEVQRAMLGPAKAAAWRAGEFELADLVGRRRSAAWGTMRYERSLREIRVAS